ncbi:hypothetical protein B0H66DRAFT_527537 [Apodospora peruviana]|uniref:Uncharacterized protein n=1 Tax=Apodospora peruviana TaxID=516989 RepID=A0AAE0MGJ0_9PEZI|nr:hypothetical protein B0H66DRAFT_527537 [Apodospora peruviana]
MASVSTQSSPKKQPQDLGSVRDKSESPILPPQYPEHSEQPQAQSIKSTDIGIMAEAREFHPKPQGSRTQVRTPEPRNSKERINGHKELAERSPSTPGHLAPFDWDDFEARYEEALSNADRDEQELLQEFDQLVKYFHVWASAASVHDTDRAVKRLQTRERYVKIAEQNLSQKKKHLTEVVRAFQSALALLSQN